MSPGLLAEMASNKSDRSMSPSTLSEEGRRELIARQHRALYGPDGSGFSPQGSYTPDTGISEQGPPNQGPGPQNMRGPSPRHGVDPFGGQQQQEIIPQPSAEGKTTSPNAHQQGKAPTPPVDDSTHQRAISKSSTAPVQGGMGPIGSSRPNLPGQNLNKRTTSPLPGGLAYGSFNIAEVNERSSSQTSGGANQSTNPGIGAWPASGVWGTKIGGSNVWSNAM